MKRLVAVSMMAGILLATSTAAFAVPTTVTQSGDALFTSTVDEGFVETDRTGVQMYTITWFQPFDVTIPPADFSAYPAGGTLTGPDTEITSAVLTIEASKINGPPFTPTVWRGTSDTTWVAQIGTLNAGSGFPVPGPSTTAITLADADTWLAPTGFYVQVRVPGGDQDVVVNESVLSGTVHWEYTYTYDEQGPDPVVPAPGAILLASMGAGLASWLRARRWL